MNNAFQYMNCIVVFNRGKDAVLFCKRKKEPYTGLLNFVGGKVEVGKTSEDAAYRELWEETGIGKQQLCLCRLMDITYYYQEFVLEMYVDKLEEEGRIRVSGKKGIDSRTGVVSIQTLSLDQAEASVLLEEQYGILTRVGLHCAPSAHKTLGTYPTGTIRFSFGFYNTQADVDAALSALEELTRGRA